MIIADFTNLFFSSYHLVGAGSAGAVVANRLSEDPRHRVLLLEAGGYETFQSEIPMLAARLQLSRWDWYVHLVYNLILLI